jgi:DNA-binding NarL/FixJ family response regulator
MQAFAQLSVGTVALFRGELTATEFDARRRRAADASRDGLPAIAAIAVEIVSCNAAVLHEPLDGGLNEEMDALIASSRERGALGELPFVLGHGACVDQRQGAWTRARVRASEAAELAGDTHQWTFRAWALVNLARIEAAQGLEVDCREHAGEALKLARQYDIGSLEVHLVSVIGLLELGLGNIASAVEQLERCARLASRHELAHPPTVPYEPDLVEALRAGGRDEDARAAAEVLQRRAQRTESPWARATAARCRGLLASEAEFEQEFEAARDLHERVPSGFERARTELCYGERLRRAGRRSDARTRLTPALGTFDQLRAAPWAERTRLELDATGITARPRRDRALADELTPQELRVALIISEGATVRDAAAQLFLSPKTIEAHLGRAYRKLDVHNRAQLARSLDRTYPAAV